MKQLFTILLALSLHVAFSQQKLIAVKGSVTDAIATTLSQAIGLAQPGDIIYLPGGHFEFTGTIDKPVHIIGTGFQDGMNVMGRTTINNNLNLGSLASGSIFEGFYLTGWFTQTGYSTIVNNLVFKRCNFEGIGIDFYSSYNDCSFINCVVRDTLHFGEASTSFGVNNTVSNSFVGNIHKAQHSTVKNCILQSKIISSDNVTIKNTVYGSSFDCNLHVNCSNIRLNNNTIASGCVENNGQGIIEYTHTIAFNSISEIFVSAESFAFNPTADFRLSPTSLSQLAGDDGTDIGIFGGSYPWKTGSLPQLPNIEKNNSYLDVPSETFKLNVKVVPQTH